MKKLTDQELATTKVGEAITLTSVMAVLSIAITAIVVYRLFKSKNGGVSLPGGYKFEWK
ncbi:MAG: hypothetical protein MJ208_02785 [Bacilli bacterium]|nr:hypothetical protein [Bacilli bacterium]